MNLILASSSPRRQELLRQVHIPFTIRKPEVDESQITVTDPAEKVKQLAMLKGRDVPIQDKDEVILSADTVVSLQQNIFEKPTAKQAAFKMIEAMSGHKHEVYTGVMLRSSDQEIVFVESTTVEFWPLTEEEIISYVETDEPYDKAGGYGIQSVGAMFVKGIIGDYYNVVGLPISRVVRELSKFEIFPR
ncbi:septum formation inhibitor Maf [Gracilibacillus salitolerans]|uniref:dTTP/UTP pyrophosphatase n=1 Tax=Gracilibacillus salitolerans TaxID=2663022 RepID=A0A5Q2TIE0_9BACI|nr:Maf family protein [Gracilibacillus salitolerans]QGH33720.1 septum formation inhibitor Maf [Gracilibacillus salitolerans]